MGSSGRHKLMQIGWAEYCYRPYVMDGPMGHANTAVDCMMDGPMGHSNTAVDHMMDGPTGQVNYYGGMYVSIRIHEPNTSIGILDNWCTPNANTRIHEPNVSIRIFPIKMY